MRLTHNCYSIPTTWSSSTLIVKRTWTPLSLASNREKIFSGLDRQAC